MHLLRDQGRRNFKLDSVLQCALEYVLSLLLSFSPLLSSPKTHTATHKIPITGGLFSTGKPPSHARPALVPSSQPNESIAREPIFQRLKNVCTQRNPFTKHDLRKVYDSLRSLRESQEECENNLPPKLSVKFDYYEVTPSPPTKFLL